MNVWVLLLLMVVCFRGLLGSAGFRFQSFREGLKFLAGRMMRNGLESQLE
jgi:hypothetical protein